MNRMDFTDPLAGARTMDDVVREIDRQNHKIAVLRGEPAPTFDASKAINCVPDDCPSDARFRVLSACSVPCDDRRVLLPQGKEFLLSRYGAAAINRWIRGSRLLLERIDLVPLAPDAGLVAFTLPDPEPEGEHEKRKRGRPRTKEA